ncbi:hypothetical protein P154DRAFT_564568 [Amniculicola lignicola CBS 123094]|uniref:CENP-V/GFA domain-containing protein n=1 Tax=Amniculicola lignicola CBS 123094 TaxID=1392246 RepID=A0A6A5WBU4_9PLEO|nr:hypothetical protein P154DRAFT_564568 [Amniculicola lignicola CBS 123094]
MAFQAGQTLHGSCACGRNRYVVEIPGQQAQHAELRYDNTSASRNHSASPLTLWLRVPLTWYTSATFSQFPDESRSSIQRTFISPFDSHSRRQFCGFCGTQLTSWHERTQDDAEHICLTVGSLLDEDQGLLGALGLLPGDSSDDDSGAAEGPSTGSARSANTASRTVARASPQGKGAPWFEEMVENSRLGRFKQQRGGHASRDGSVRVEWEVMEWTEADDADDEGSGNASSPAKRKLGDIVDEDTEMRTVVLLTLYEDKGNEGLWRMMGVGQRGGPAKPAHPITPHRTLTPSRIRTDPVSPRKSSRPVEPPRAPSDVKHITNAIAFPMLQHTWRWAHQPDTMADAPLWSLGDGLGLRGNEDWKHTYSPSRCSTVFQIRDDMPTDLFPNPNPQTLLRTT